MKDIAHRLRESAKETFYDPLKSELNEAASHIEKLEAALEKISRERTLWGAMRKADHALGKFEDKALEGKDD
jgi:ppGpp synthetase/RelA/SpoT-type nucleotidyltranferase